MTAHRLKGGNLPLNKKDFLPLRVDPQLHREVHSRSQRVVLSPTARLNPGFRITRSQVADGLRPPTADETQGNLAVSIRNRRSSVQSGSPAPAPPTYP
jgi:hypothetical protein